MLKKQASAYTQEFVVLSDSKDHHDKMKDFLSGKFDDMHVEHHVVEGEQVAIAGEGRHYKRSVEQDTKKLL